MLRGRVGGNGVVRTSQTFWLKSYKGLKSGHFSDLSRFFAFFGHMIKQNSVTVPSKVMKSAGNLVGTVTELPKTFRSYVSKARRFFRPVSNPEMRKTAKRARDRSAFLPQARQIPTMSDKWGADFIARTSKNTSIALILSLCQFSMFKHSAKIENTQGHTVWPCSTWHRDMHACACVCTCVFM